VRIDHVVSIEVADEEIEGAYAVVNNALAKMLCQKYRYINREEDMGLQGLRRAKESYRPAIRLMRYTAAQSGAKS
ncbi:MAG: phosphatidylglycerol lysyltransferase domain-containing protein, partial [Eubacteriales bacterium]